MLVNGLTFIFSAFVEVFVHTDRQEIESKASLKNSFVSDLIDGLKYLHSEKEIQRVVLISSLTNFFLAGYNLFLPFLNTLMQNPNVYSIALSFQAIGGIFGSFLNIHANKKSGRFALILPLFVCGFSMCIIPPISSFTTNMYITLFPFLLFDASLTLFNIRFISNVQCNTQQEYSGRVFGTIFTLAMLFMPLGSFFFHF